jgi:lysophospholipase L1-like esterase
MTRPLAFVFLAASTLAAASSCGGDEPDTTARMYDADDANIQYTGRIDYTNPKQPKFSLAATYMTVRFKGTGVSVLLKDEHRWGKWRNYYDAIVDGMVVKKIRPDDDVSVVKYEVATGLAYGEHELVVVKRTEPNVGNGFFFGVEIAGEILPPPARPTRKMLFFGDSITAGSGIEVPDGDPGCRADEWGQPVENADRAYAAEAARMLDAEYHVLGVSGIGLVRNYSSDTANDLRPMPMVWNLQLPQLTSSPVWTTADDHPDAIVIALGTNDFSPGDNPASSPRPKMEVATFVAAYIQLVDALRAAYGTGPHIFAVSSSMLADGWPDATYRSLTDQKDALAMVEAHYAAGGDSKVHKLYVSKQGGGCGTHPNVAGHAATAGELVPVVKSTLMW